MDRDNQLLSEAYKRLCEASEPSHGDQKIHRDAFIYLSPKEPKEKFAQCETCQMWTDSKRNRCAILGEQTEVKGDWSCGLYIHGKPTPDQDCKPTVTSEEVGLTAHQVRCENCAAFDAENGICIEFQKLNEALPHMFDLDPKVEAYACCNTWHAKKLG